LNTEYKAKLEADLAAEIERVRLEKEAEEERKRIAEEKRQKAIRAERVRKIKEEQERLELEVRRVDMKKEGMTNEEINLVFERERIEKERERMEKEARLREEEERRQEEEKQRLLAEAEKLRNRFAKKKKKGDKARRQTAGGLLESASRTSSAPQPQQKSRLLAAVEKQSKLQNNNPSPPKSKLLEAVSKQSKKRSKRHTVDTLAAHKKEGKTVVTIDGSGEGNNTEVVVEEPGEGGSKDNETDIPSKLDSLSIGEANVQGEGSVSTGGSRLLAAVNQQSRNNSTIATPAQPLLEEKCDKPTSIVVSPPPPKPQPHNKLPEKVLLSTDGSSDRVTEVEERLQNELQQLKLDIQRVGDPTQPACSFGELFADEFAEQFYEGIAATLKAAKKRGIVKYNSPLLLKGAHDNVMITLVADKPVAEEPVEDTSTPEVSSEEPVQVDTSTEEVPQPGEPVQEEKVIEITTTSLEKVEIEGGDTHDIDKVQDTDSTSGSRPSLEDEEEEEELPTYEEWLAANGEKLEAGEC